MMRFTTCATLRQVRLLSRSMPRQNAVVLTNPRSWTPVVSFSTTSCRQVLVRKPASFEKVRFTPSDVPPLTFWKNAAQPSLVSDLDPEECLSTAHRYVELAIANGPDWQKALTKPPHSLSPAILHYIAVIITTGPSQPAWNIALHILQTLTILDYAPSVLTMAHMALVAKKLGQPQFQLAEEKTAKLARRKDDPNACTLQGLIIAAQSTPEADRQALDWFRTAASLGGEEPGAWEWQGSCALEMGRAYMRLKQPEKARDIWEYCAKQLDLEEGCWLYANSLEPLHPERYEWVQKAAIGGLREAAREMAIYESLSTEKEKAGTWEKKAGQVLQAEWEALARNRAVA